MLSCFILFMVNGYVHNFIVGSKIDDDGNGGGDSQGSGERSCFYGRSSGRRTSCYIGKNYDSWCFLRSRYVDHAFIIHLLIDLFSVFILWVRNFVMCYPDGCAVEQFVHFTLVCCEDDIANNLILLKICHVSFSVLDNGLISSVNYICAFRVTVLVYSIWETPVT